MYVRAHIDPSTGQQRKVNGKQSWRLRWERKDPGTGKRQQFTETFHGSKTAARDRWIEHEAEIRAAGAGFVKPDKQTVGEYLEWWLNTYGESNLKATTLASYRSMAKHHVIPGLGAVPLADLTATQVATWQADTLRKTTYRGGPISPKRVTNARTMLHAALKEAVRLDLLPSNPVSKVRAPKANPKRVGGFTAEQVTALMAAAKGHALEPVLAVAWQTGMRSGELRGLRWADCDLKAGTAKVEQSAASTGGPVFMQTPKTERSARTIALPAPTVVILRAHRARQAEERMALGARWKDHDLVFPTSLGTAMHSGRAEQVYKDFRDAAGLPPLPFHALRHTYGSLALLAGVPLETVSENLGHRDISFTKRIYADVLLEQKRVGADLMAQVIHRVKAGG